MGMAFQWQFSTLKLTNIFHVERGIVKKVNFVSTALLRFLKSSLTKY